jgi:hypothetical protein
LGISSVFCTAKENSDKYRQEKEAIKVDFIRWVLIFKIEVEVNEIGSSIAVKYLFPKEGVPLKHPD